MNVQDAIAEVQANLLAGWKDAPQHAKVHIYTWGDWTHGVRVAEVSFAAIDPATSYGGGSSFMQADPSGGAACFFAERAILSRINNEPVEEIEDADWRLNEVVWGEAA